MKEAKNRFKIDLVGGIAKLVPGLLFGGALLFFSGNQVTANESNDHASEEFVFPEELTPETMAAIQSSNGKIQMTMDSFVTNNDYFFHVLVWNTQTGKSKLYHYGSGRFSKANYQLPSTPVY